MIKRISAIVLRHLFLLRRSWYRVLALFYWSTLDLFLWGILTLYLNKVGEARVNFVTLFLGALILWNFFTRAQHGITVSFLEDMWSRNIANVLATPISIGEFLLGGIAISFFETLLSISFMSLLAWLFAAFNLFAFGFKLFPFMSVLFVFGWALGVLTMSIILRFGSSVDILAWSIPALLMPFSAVFYPVSTLPNFLQPISRFLPTSYVFEGMRAAVFTGRFVWASFFSALALSVVALTLSVALFAFVSRLARRRGILIRFSTE